MQATKRAAAAFTRAFATRFERVLKRALTILKLRFPWSTNRQWQMANAVVITIEAEPKCRAQECDSTAESIRGATKRGTNCAHNSYAPQSLRQSKCQKPQPLWDDFTLLELKLGDWDGAEADAVAGLLSASEELPIQRHNCSLSAVANANKHGIMRGCSCPCPCPCPSSFSHFLWPSRVSGSIWPVTSSWRNALKLDSTCWPRERTLGLAKAKLDATGIDSSRSCDCFSLAAPQIVAWTRAWTCPAHARNDTRLADLK